MVAPTVRLLVAYLSLAPARAMDTFLPPPRTAPKPSEPSAFSDVHVILQIKEIERHATGDEYISATLTVVDSQNLNEETVEGLVNGRLGRDPAYIVKKYVNMRVEQEVVMRVKAMGRIGGVEGIGIMPASGPGSDTFDSPQAKALTALAGFPEPGVEAEEAVAERSGAVQDSFTLVFLSNWFDLRRAHAGVPGEEQLSAETKKVLEEAGVGVFDIGETERTKPDDRFADLKKKWMEQKCRFGIRDFDVKKEEVVMWRVRVLTEELSKLLDALSQ